MISKRLVSQIEENADKLAADLVRAVKSDTRAKGYHALSDQKFEEYILDLYKNLGHWLRSRTWSTLESVYERKGRDRYHDGIPLAQVLFAFTKTKSMLLEFLTHSVQGDSSERDLELALVNSISQFFDRVLYHIAVGYEDARSADLAHPAMTESQRLKIKKDVQNVQSSDCAGAAKEMAEEMPISRSGDVGEVSG